MLVTADEITGHEMSVGAHRRISIKKHEKGPKMEGNGGDDESGR